MIRPLRTRHLWMVAATAAVVAPLYLAALAARPAPPIQREPVQSEPVQKALPSGPDEQAAATSGDGVELPTTPPIRVRAAGRSAIEIRSEGAVEGADLLLYWAPAPASRSLADAHLLGALRGGERQVLDLPEAALEAPGALVLYSLGHGEEIASARWPPDPGSAP